MVFTCSRVLTEPQVATGRKSALMSVIGCRTDETNLYGVMDEADGYENLHVFSELKQYLLSDIRSLQEYFEPSQTNDGDCGCERASYLTWLTF